MEYSRTDERTKCMQSLYQVLLCIEQKTDYDATEIICSMYDVDDFSKVPVYSRCLYSMALEHYDEIKSEVSKYLVNWTFERLDTVAQAILFVGYAEGVYCRFAPRKVVINEAVSMAKNYLKTNDHKFINAVLDKAIPPYEFKN